MAKMSNLHLNYTTRVTDTKFEFLFKNISKLSLNFEIK